MSDDDKEFQVETFKWLLKNFGGDDFYEKTDLVLPIQAHFPSNIDGLEDAVQETFATVKRHAGLENWICKLQAQEDDINAIVAPTLVIQNAPVSPHGTFSLNDQQEVIITYNPALVTQPIQMVATFAHELAHYLTATAGEDPPGGWENWEFVTDIAATFLGFGVFMANSAFNFKQFTDTDSQGWQSNNNGYMSESEHVYALAIFIGLKDLPIDTALTHLKPHLRKLLKKALKEVLDTNLITDLKNVVYSPSS